MTTSWRFARDASAREPLRRYTGGPYVVLGVLHPGLELQCQLSFPSIPLRMFQGLDRHVTRLFAGALGTICVGILFASYHTSQRAEEARLVSHTRDVINELNASISLLNEAESSELGYALTGDEGFVSPFERNGALAMQHLGAAASLFQGAPHEQARVVALSGSVMQTLASMRSNIDERRARGLETVVRALRTTFGSTDILRIRDSVRVLESDEQRRLAIREATLESSSRYSSWAMGGLGVLSLAILALAAATVRTALLRQRDAERKSVQANAELSVRVHELLLRGRENAARQQLSEALQLCLTPDEAYTAIALILPTLLGATQGGGLLAVIRPTGNQLETVARWGALVDDHSITAMEPEHCCALRSGQPYIVTANEVRLRCAHAETTSGDYVCIPLAAHGETLGILHVVFAALEAANDTQEYLLPSAGATPADAITAVSSNPTFNRRSDAVRMELVKQASEQVSVALANLALRDRLKQQTIRDALTGAFNRRYLEEAIERETMRARRHGKGLSLLMLDIDHFKRINDQFGHESGDEVLRTIADCLTRSVRAEDIVCRYGGEEFAILLPEVTAETARMRAQKVVEACRSQRVVLRNEPIGPVTVSIGLAIHGAIEESSVELLRRADGALYTAKREGRNRVVEAEPRGTDVEVDAAA